ncbi:hypothetical protein ACWC3X_31480 [Streptomyces populi]
MSSRDDDWLGGLIVVLVVVGAAVAAVFWVISNLAPLLAWISTLVLVCLLCWLPWAALRQVRDRNAHLRRSVWPVEHTRRDWALRAAAVAVLAGLLLWPFLSEARGAWNGPATLPQWAGAVLPLLPPAILASRWSTLPAVQEPLPGQGPPGPFSPEGPAHGTTSWLGVSAGAVDPVRALPSGNREPLDRPGIWTRQTRRAVAAESRPDPAPHGMRLVKTDPQSCAWVLRPHRPHGGS